MYTYKRTNLKNQTVSLNISVQKDEIQKRFDVEHKKLAQNVKVEGFRAGKAPFELTKGRVKQDKVYDQLVQNLISEIYAEVVKKEDLKPIISPRVELKKTKLDEDWQFELTIALKPVIKLPDYKKIISDVKAKHQKDELWVPGKDIEKPSEKEASEQKQKMLNEILDELVKKTTLELSDIIIDQEIQDRLAKLVDDVEKIGLTVDGYLNSKGLTKEQIQAQFHKEVLEMFTIEYALSRIGDEEKIAVDEADIKAFMESVKDQKNQEVIKSNLYFYSSMLRKQKILAFLVGS